MTQRIFLLVLLVVSLVLTGCSWTGGSTDTALTDTTKTEKPVPPKYAPIQDNPEEIRALEQSVKLKHEVKKSGDTYTVTAKAVGLTSLKDIVINDFSEDIRFPIKFEQKDVKIKALRGKAFPEETVSFISYGAGPIEKRATKAPITLTDLKIDNKTDEVALYEVSFTSKENIETLDFKFPQLSSAVFDVEVAEETLQIQ